MKLLQIFLILIVTHLHAGPVWSDVWISEIEAVNERGLEDEDGDDSDWLELFNAGVSPVDLSGFFLSDDPDQLTQWSFPNGVSIDPGEFLVVFASGKDRREAGAPLHTNFKLSSEGEFLALSRPDGVTLEHSITFPQQVEDVSWGFPMQVTVWDLLGSDLPYFWKVIEPSELESESESESDLKSFPIIGQDSIADWNMSRSWALGYELGTIPASSVGYRNRVLRDGPVGYWDLDEEADSELFDNQGEIGVAGDGIGSGAFESGEAPWLAGSKSSVLFSAAGRGKIDVAFHPDLNPEIFTAELWARVDGSAGSYRSPLTSRDDSPQRGYIIYASASDRWEFWTGSGSQSGWNTLNGPAVEIGKWVYLAIQYDGAFMKFFVDGELAGSRSAAFGPNRERPLRIGGGATEGAGSFFFDGAVDSVAVYSRALSAASIRERYELGRPQVDDETGEPLTRDYEPWIGTDIEDFHEAPISGAWIQMEIPFEFEPGDLPDTEWPFHEWRVGMKYDDGYELYWNDQLVDSRNAVGVERRPDSLAVDWEWTSWTCSAAIEAGWRWDFSQNQKLSIKALNASGVNDPDFLIHPKVEAALWTIDPSAQPRYFKNSSPGMANPSASENLNGPLIIGVSHFPDAPLFSDSVKIEAEMVLDSSSPIEWVRGFYRIQYGSEVEFDLNDQGENGDQKSGDGVYTGWISANVGQVEQMGRYRIEASGGGIAGEQLSRYPMALDQSGTRQSAEYDGFVFNAKNGGDGLPVFYWYSENPSSAHSRSGSRVSVYYNGDFLDNAFARERGQATAIGSQKFTFNSGDRLRMTPDLPKVGEININSNGADPSFIRQPLAFQILRELGSPAPICFPIEMRLNGQFDRVGMLIEQVDEDFLKRNGIDPSGALYKFVQRRELTPAFSNTTDGLEKKIGIEDDFSDLQELVDALNSRDPERVDSMLFESLDLPSIINYLAIRALIRDVDCIRKNYYFYRDTAGDARWRFFPWDKDLSMGTGVGDPLGSHPFLGTQSLPLAPLDQWNMLLDAIYKQPEIRAMFLRRLRTIMDETMGYSPRLGISFFSDRLSFLADSVSPYVSSGARASASGLSDFWNRHRNTLYNVHALELNEPDPNPPVSSLIAGIPPESFDSDERLIRIEEIRIAQPDGGFSPFDQVVLINTGSAAVDLSGWTLEGTASYSFTSGAVIPAGFRVVVGEVVFENVGSNKNAKVPANLVEEDPVPITWRLGGLVWNSSVDLGGPDATVQLKRSNGEAIHEKSFALPGDLDQDQLQDAWERFYFGSFTFAQAEADLDQDGLTNLEEYHQGTDPTQPSSQRTIQFNWRVETKEWELEVPLDGYDSNAYSTGQLSVVIESANNTLGVWSDWIPLVERSEAIGSIDQNGIGSFLFQLDDLSLDSPIYLRAVFQVE